MKKIFYILVSAIVALGAVACNNEIDENIEANRSEGVSFTASLDETASRILVGDLNESGKHPITFESDDVIYATYFGEGGIVAPFAFTTTDGVTFTCLENNADGLAPQTLIGQSVEFSVNEFDSSKGVDGIVLYASQSFENKSTVTLGLANYCGVFAFTSSHDVTLTASEGIFSWKIDEDDYQTGTTITIPAAEGIQYVPFIPQNEAITLSYSVNGEKVKEITREFSNKIYTLGGLNEAVASVNGVNYTDINKAIEAAPSGSTITLKNDVELIEALAIPADKELTLDLGESTISAVSTEAAASALVKNDGTLNIVGAGTITYKSEAPSATNAYASNAISNYGTLVVGGDVVIENTTVGGACYAIDNYAGATCTIKDNATLKAAKTTVRIFNWNSNQNTTLNVEGGTIISEDGYAINTNTGAAPNYTLNISGGTITTNDTDYNLSVYMVAHEQSGVDYDGTNYKFNVTGGTFNGWFAINGKSATLLKEGNAEISGGTFNVGVYAYDTPAVKFVKGGKFVADPTDYVVDGYQATLNGEYYEISEYVPAASIGGEEYETIEEALVAAKEIGGEVTVNVVAGTYDSFPADKLTEGVTLECAEGTVFEGSSSLNIGGATVKGATFSNDGGNAVGGTVNGDFEDCVFTGTNGHRYCYLPEDGEITYTNCVFEGSVYGVHFDGGGDGAKLIFRNCEFYGFNALPGTIDVEFYGCFFGHKEGGSGYNGINLWGNTYMQDTQFDWTADGVIEYCDPCQATPTYEFKNVTVNKTGTWEPIQFSDMYQPEGVVVTIDGVVYQNVADGVCTVDGVYEISNKNGMFWFANEVNANGNNFSGKTVKLANNIDLESAAWTPVGQTGATQFTGSFDGQDHTIYGLTINAPASYDSNDAAGFFGWLESYSGSVIKNIKFDGATIAGYHYVGTVAGYISGGTEISGCEVTNSTIAALSTVMTSDTNEYRGDKVGGIVGFTNSNNKINNNKVSKTQITGYRQIGGIAGYLYASANGNSIEEVTINVCNDQNTENYTVRNQYGVGSLFGVTAGTATNNTGEATINWGEIPAAFKVVNNAGWDKVYLYAWQGENKILGEWPGVEISNGYAAIPAEYVGETVNYVIHNNNGIQTADLKVDNFEDNFTDTIGDPKPETITIYLNNNWSVENLKLYTWEPALWGDTAWATGQKEPTGTVTTDWGTFTYWDVPADAIATDKVGNLLVTGTGKQTADLTNVDYSKDVYLEFNWTSEKGDHLVVKTTPY
ncbi:MAG: starch-binding protein [Tidjanibacter sp.]|nr:starch-binding protein [Tidjanibacter sp.]